MMYAAFTGELFLNRRGLQGAHHQNAAQGLSRPCYPTDVYTHTQICMFVS